MAMPIITDAIKTVAAAMGMHPSALCVEVFKTAKSFRGYSDGKHTISQDDVRLMCQSNLQDACGDKCDIETIAMATKEILS